MKEHPNFYENVKEAMLRLRRTVVMYDGEPYVVFCITDHKSNGIFRIYLDPTGQDPNVLRKLPDITDFPPEHPDIGGYIDTFMAQNPDTKLIRKEMNSPLFNKFRPYPLGMCNIKGGGVYYVERQPNRKTEQGLVSSMLYDTPITTSPSSQPRRTGAIDVYGMPFRDCCLGNYPTAAECLSNLLDPDVTNEGVAFHREFALVRGPVDMIFVAYKHDIVGVLPKNDFSCVRLGREFRHTKEVFENLRLFSNIIL
jgi:hypothetical protein